MLKSTMRHKARHLLRKTIIVSKPYLSRSPLLKSGIKRILDLSPNLKARLLRLGKIEQPLIEVKQRDQLSKEARENYDRLKKALDDKQRVTS